MIVFFRQNSIYLIFILSLSCQTIMGPSEEEQKQAEIIRTQKSMVINFLNKGLPGLANKELKEHLKNYPTDPDFKNLQGLTLLALKNPNKAIPFLREAYKIENRIPFGLNIASAYIEAGQYPKAVGVLKSLKKHDEYSNYRHPERIDHNLGLAYERMNKIDIAKNYYQDSLANNPTFYISLMRLGHILNNSKKYKHARILYRRAYKACLECFEPISGIAMTFIAQGKPRFAITALKSFVKTNRASKADLRRAEEMIHLANKFDKSKRHKVL